jgi:hypothetical protein
MMSIMMRRAIPCSMPRNRSNTPDQRHQRLRLSCEVAEGPSETRPFWFPQLDRRRWWQRFVLHPASQGRSGLQQSMNLKPKRWPAVSQRIPSEHVVDGANTVTHCWAGSVTRRALHAGCVGTQVAADRRSGYVRDAPRDTSQPILRWSG